jgi:TIR domain
MTTVIPPTTFISYSWDSDEHREWVEQFATDLRRDGIDAALDTWDLPAGTDKFSFMGSIQSRDWIIVVCTPDYANRAERRRGGVGVETVAILSELFADDPANRQNVIPVLRLGEWSTSVPGLLRHLIGFDLRADHSGVEYLRLLGTLKSEGNNRPTVGESIALGPLDERVAVRRVRLALGEAEKYLRSGLWEQLQTAQSFAGENMAPLLALDSVFGDAYVMLPQTKAAIVRDILAQAQTDVNQFLEILRTQVIPASGVERADATRSARQQLAETHKRFSIALAKFDRSSN